MEELFFIFLVNYSFKKLFSNEIKSKLNTIKCLNE